MLLVLHCPVFRAPSVRSVVAAFVSCKPCSVLWITLTTSMNFKMGALRPVMAASLVEVTATKVSKLLQRLSVQVGLSRFHISLFATLMGCTTLGAASRQNVDDRWLGPGTFRADAAATLMVASILQPSTIKAIVLGVLVWPKQRLACYNAMESILAAHCTHITNVSLKLRHFRGLCPFLPSICGQMLKALI